MISPSRLCRIAIGSLLVCLTTSAVAQDQPVPAAKRTTIWLGAGYGRGYAENYLDDQQALSVNLSAQRGSLLLSTRVAAVSHDLFDTAWDIGVLGGLASEASKPVHGGLALGLGYAEVERGGRSLAIPAELQLFWRFSRYAGIGAYVFGSFGEEQFAGATLGLQVGRLR